MIYRFNRLFNVSRGRAALVAVLCFIAACFMTPLGADFASVTAGMFMFSFIYGGIWYYKYNRDKKLSAQAKVSNPPSLEVEQSITTPGSHHLFVPNPLDRQQ